MTVPANVTRFLFQIPYLDETLRDQSLRVVGFDIEASLSAPYRCNLELACEHSSLDLSLLVGKAGLLTLFDERHPQYLHGEILQIQQGESGSRFTLYTLTLVPKLEFLRYRSNLRIFQQQSVPDIVQRVLAEAGIKDLHVRFELKDSYTKREYCTQYQETDFDFINRLLEEEGIGYFFEHLANAHVLVFSDSNDHFQTIAGDVDVRFKERSGMLGEAESIYDFQVHARIRPGAVTLRDYNMDKTRLRLEQRDQQGAFIELEQYRYRGNFSDPAVGARYTRLQREALQLSSEEVEGQTDCTRFAVGRRFRIKDHPQRALNSEYVLHQLRVRGRQPQSLGEGSSAKGTEFDVLFKAFPTSVPYRPLPHTPSPIVRGTQTAFVTGPSGEEIYTDRLGRVKVQFHWDREGRYDEHSSCWLRVSQALAGNEWGAMVLPRIGQEVIVSFLEGNPDRPMVTGALYNGSNSPPYSLPRHKTRSTFKSFSSPGGAGFNELLLEDKKGSEQIYLHAAKDLDLCVRYDWKEWIGNECHTTVKGTLNQSVSGEQNTTIKKNQNLQVDGNHSHDIGQGSQLKVGGSYLEQAGQDIVLKAGMSLVIEAGVELTLKAGGGLVKLDPSGVTITGTLVRINSGGSAVPGRPAVVTTPQAPAAAEPGGKAGKHSAAAIPNTT